MLRQIRNKGLINYCENAAYYNAGPGLSIKERKKTTHVQTTLATKKKFKTKLSLPTCSLV